jgi:hypothetical protein
MNRDRMTNASAAVLIRGVCSPLSPGPGPYRFLYFYTMGIPESDRPELNVHPLEHRRVVVGGRGFFDQSLVKLFVPSIKAVNH